MKHFSLLISVTVVVLCAVVIALALPEGQHFAAASSRPTAIVEGSRSHPDRNDLVAQLSAAAVAPQVTSFYSERASAAGNSATTATTATLSPADIIQQTTTAAGHKVEAVPGAAKITCQLQSLEGDLTPAGLHIRSTGTSEPGSFSVRTAAWGRDDNIIPVGPGQVVVDGSIARLIHEDGITEEISTTSAGIRQDWVLNDRPIGSGALNVNVTLIGATITGFNDSQMNLTVTGGRELMWHQLMVTDAVGTQLAARFDNPSDNDVRLIIDDQLAVYPIRIDPTFTDSDWVSMGGIGGVSSGGPRGGGTVFALAPYGTGILMAGDFNHAGTVEAHGVAYWDGNSWSTLGTGVNNIVNAITVLGTDIYVGGDFTTAGGVTANYIAKWNGSAWSSLGSGMNATVRALTVLNGDVYAGGDFTTADGGAASRVAKWNGNRWSALGSGTDGKVYAMTVANSKVYAGGIFTTAGGITARNIAAWDGATWSLLKGSTDHNDGTDGPVYALAASGSNVYVGGNFYYSGIIRSNYVAKWDGSGWSGLGNGVGLSVRALAVINGDVYVGGIFGTIDDVQFLRLAKWNGSVWSQLEHGVNHTVYALAASGSNLFVGGLFGGVNGETNLTDREAYCIAKWNGSAWSQLRSAIDTRTKYKLNKAVHTIALSDSGAEVYVGGSFNIADGGVADYLAKWDGSTWSSVGGGVNGIVGHLTISGSDLYVLGDFTMAGGVPANRIAKWNGSSWSTFGTGINDSVNALVVYEGELYAAGAFTEASGAAVNYCAKWTGSAWVPVGTGMNGSINAMVVMGNAIYAVGFFTEADGNAANHIAKWNGSAWLPVGLGVNNNAHSISVSGTNLYVGGVFTQAGGVAAQYIAKWNGSTWSALGGGTPNYVWAVASSGSNVYAGGLFTGAETNHIMHWDGSAWHAMGSGINDIVYTLAAANNKVYAGGKFIEAGGKTSIYVAMAAIPYAITYSANGATGGSVPASQAKSHGFAVNLATNSGGLVKSGWTFAGWNTAANGSGTAYAAGATYAVNTDVTLYAQWANTYTVTYNGNGNTSGSAPSAQTKNYGVSLTLATNSGGLAKTGLLFYGWNTAANGSGTTYAAGATYTANATLTLYAQWKATYVITYNGNGHTSGNVPANQSKIQGVNLILASNSDSLAKTGSTFVGWNTATDGSGTAYSAGATYSTNAAATLYAQWTTLATYQVTYDGNGHTDGRVPSTQTKVENATLTLATNNGGLEKTDMTFAGWNSAADGSGTTYAAGASYSANAAITLYAKWTAVGSGGGSDGSGGGGGGGGCGAGSGFASALGLLLLLCGMRLNGLGIRHKP